MRFYYGENPVDDMIATLPSYIWSDWGKTWMLCILSFAIFGGDLWMGRSTPNFKSFSYHHAPYGKSRIFLVCPIFRHPKKICKHNQRNPANLAMPMQLRSSAVSSGSNRYWKVVKVSYWKTKDSTSQGNVFWS
jgi:hypothetical protein